jgi:serine/threonine protein kinase
VREGWTLVTEVGAGAFKCTFHIRAGSESRALKVYLKGFSERSSREIEAMKRCSHANIAKFLELNSIELNAVTYLYLVEEFLAGGSLTARVGRLSRADIVSMVLKLADAIEHIAAQQLVHRDLKPDNIMFRTSSNVEPVIVDFGLVRDLSSTSLTATWLREGPGTPKFAAPEQLNNEKGMVAARTDQFGLAMALGFAFFNSHPFAYPGDDDGMAIARVAAWQTPSPAFVQLCTNAKLDPFVKMLQPFPVDRFLTSRDLKEAWRKVA